MSDLPPSHSTQPNGSRGAGRPLRVAMVVQRFRPHIGGAERQIERLAPRLERRGVEVVVVTRRLEGTSARERLPGLRVVRVAMPPGGRGAGLAYALGGAAQLLRLRPDVIHVHGLLSESLAGLAAARLGGAPMVVKLLSAGPEGCVDRLLAKPFGARRLRAVASGASALITLTERSDEELLQRGVAAERLVRIPNGVDTERFRPPREGERERLRQELGLPADGEPLALYCGRLEPTKRVGELLEAFAAQPRGRLLVLGGGSEEEALRERAGRADLQGRVLLRAPVEDTAPYYRAADLYLSASAREGMSGSALEAMASGLCVAAAPAGGMRELLGGGAGVLLPEPGSRAYVAAVGALLADPAERQRHGRAARELVARRYSLERAAQRLLELYGWVRAGGIGAPRGAATPAGVPQREASP